MKRFRNLYANLCSFENLLAASIRARRRKRSRRDVEAFEFHLEQELHSLAKELREHTYEPGKLRDFWIKEPKPRLISAAPYRDRVVHHALCRVIEPIFERTFIHDSYASRRGKGIHAAVTRYQRFSRRQPYVLKCDIRKFFPSIDHQILMQTIERKIADPEVLLLIARILGNSAARERVSGFFPGDTLLTQLERPRGLPIGNQTSQFFGNVFLNSLDHFVKQTLQVRGYVRYVDDFVLLGDSTEQLWDHCAAIEEFLLTRRLWLHRRKRVVSRVEDGIRFLGYRVFPTHCRMPQQSVLRFRRRLRRTQREFACGLIPLETVRQRIMSWNGHASHAATTSLLRSLLQITFQKGNAVDQSRVAWRGVQQQQPGQPAIRVSQQQHARQP